MKIDSKTISVIFGPDLIYKPSPSLEENDQFLNSTSEQSLQFILDNWSIIALNLLDNPPDFTNDRTFESHTITSSPTLTLKRPDSIPRTLGNFTVPLAMSAEVVNPSPLVNANSTLSDRSESSSTPSLDHDVSTFEEESDQAEWSSSQKSRHFSTTFGSNEEMIVGESISQHANARRILSLESKLASSDAQNIQLQTEIENLQQRLSKKEDDSHQMRNALTESESKRQEEDDLLTRQWKEEVVRLESLNKSLLDEMDRLAKSHEESKAKMTGIMNLLGVQA